MVALTACTPFVDLQPAARQQRAAARRGSGARLPVLFPEDLKYTTPPHQDFQPVRGAPDTWTAWVPYGDCDETLGGLAVVERSNGDGWLPVGADHETVAVDAGAPWVWSPMAAGDVLLFHSLTIHQGVDNTSSDRIRLAGSFRYQAGQRACRRRRPDRAPGRALLGGSVRGLGARRPAALLLAPAAAAGPAGVAHRRQAERRLRKRTHHS